MWVNECYWIFFFFFIWAPVFFLLSKFLNLLVYLEIIYMGILLKFTLDFKFITPKFVQLSILLYAALGATLGLSLLVKSCRLSGFDLLYLRTNLWGGY